MYGTINVAIFRGGTLCSPYVYRCFGGTYDFREENQPILGDTFFRNVGSRTDYTALYPRKWQHS
jgi:hypothetical protein